MQERPTLMMSPHVGGSPPLMAAPQPQRSRERVVAPSFADLTALLWCYAAAAAFALLLAHTAH
jgi:hypothetical protein